MRTDEVKKNYRIFLISMLFMGISAALFKGVLDNYLADILNVSKSGRGIVEFFREMPGFFLFLILALFYTIAEHRILQIGFLIAAMGVIGFLLSGTQPVAAVFFLVVYSTGEHILMPVRQSFAVHSAQKGAEGSALGLMRSIQSVGQVGGFFAVPLIFLFFSGITGFRISFFVVVLLLFASLFIAMKLKDDGQRVRRQRLYFHKKFMLYYVLQNFYGARKQVFLTFGPYVLILNYGASPSVIASLMGFSAVLNIFGSPLIGRIIDKIGYKKVMVGDTLILMVVCLIYGFAHHLFPMNIAYIVIASVFVLDTLISHASMAASVYVKDLSATREEMTATLTTGISLDHLISIFIALAGGMIWEFLGIELLFVTAAVMAVMNSLVAMMIKPVRPESDI
jgi:predicted MFS family arabinose efflux permease